MKSYHSRRTGGLQWSELPGGGFYPFGLRERKGETLHRLGRFAELKGLCLEDLERCRGDDRVAGFCLMKLGVLSAQQGDYEAGRERLSKAIESFRRTGEAKNAFICRSALVNISLNERRFAEAEAAAAELAAETESSDDQAVLGTVLNLQGLAAMELGQREKALDLFQRKLDLSRRHGMVVDQATALGNMGRLYHELGRFDESEVALHQSLAICRHIGDLYMEYYALYILAEAYEAQGKLAEAERSYRDDLKLARQLGDGPGERGLLEDIERVAGADR